MKSVYVFVMVCAVWCWMGIGNADASFYAECQLLVFVKSAQPYKKDPKLTELVFSVRKIVRQGGQKKVCGPFLNKSFTRAFPVPKGMLVKRGTTHHMKFIEYGHPTPKGYRKGTVWSLIPPKKK